LGIDAEEAIEKALEVARKAGVPTLFAMVVDAKKADDKWEIIIESYERKFKALLDANTGEAVGWSEISDRKD